MKYIKGGATAAKGFYTAGLRAGIKVGKTNKDMAALFSEVPATSAGVYTKNIVKAAPVKWDKEITSSDNKVSAVIVNTGYANACTGDEGYKNVIEEATLAADVFGCEKENVLIASTGIIGQQLPMDAIKKGIPMLKDALSDSVEMSEIAAEAIMTTDTKPKFTAVEFTLSGKTVRLGGMCKGSGMIHPNMGTMLGFITTDAAITKQMLQKALSDDVCDTFNMVSVDGDTSTNDTVILLANGMAENEIIDCENEDYKTFCKALNTVTTYLARAIAADGEGATKLFTVTVEGAPTKDIAVTISKSVVSSSSLSIFI